MEGYGYGGAGVEVGEEGGLEGGGDGVLHLGCSSEGVFVRPCSFLFLSVDIMCP